ncbi:MAG: MMPL family transporter [Nocardioidaceae bacterium]
MSVLLYRFGKFAFRRKWIVLPIWFVAFVALIAVALTISKPYEDSFEAGDLPSERATEIMDEHFPGMSKEFDADAVTGSYVIEAPDGESLTDPKYRDVIGQLVDDLNGLDTIDHEQPLQDPIAATEEMGCLEGDRGADEFAAQCSGAPLNVLNEAAPDTVAYVDTVFTMEFADMTPEHQDEAYDLADPARDAGLTVEVGGIIGQEVVLPGGTAELIGFGVALLVMIIVFGALVAAFIPIITAIVGVVSASMIVLMGTAVTEIPSFTTFLMSMIGIALSIDYALFIVSRYKHEQRGAQTREEREEAAGRALGTAGSAVVFAGLTVIIALSGLSIVGFRFLTLMGFGAAIAAGFAVVVALTLMPALLGAFGTALFKPKIPFVAKHDPEDDTSVTNGIRFARLIGRMPAVTLAAGVIVLAGLAVPAAGLSLGLPGEESLPEEQSARKAYDIRTDGFGEGKNGVLQIAVDLADVPKDQRDAALDDMRTEFESYDQMDYVAGPIMSEDKQGALFEGVPLSGPNNQDTKDVMQDVRDAEDTLNADYGLAYGVTGTTAIYADIDNKMLDAIVPYMAIVAGAAFLLLILVFRSVLIPLTAALGYVLSVSATFGAVVLIFQEGAFGLVDDPRPIASFMPIMMIGLIFGLAMDYTVFTVTRMREEYIHGRPPLQAMINGYHHGARVVTAAAIIMMSVFGAFIMEVDITSKQMGFGLATAILLDAFIVRMVIMPSLLALMGKAAWWLPSWLDRILPNMDVEGEKITKLTAERTKEPEYSRVS